MKKNKLRVICKLYMLFVAASMAASSCKTSSFSFCWLYFCQSYLIFVFTHYFTPSTYSLRRSQSESKAPETSKIFQFSIYFVVIFINYTKNITTNQSGGFESLSDIFAISLQTNSLTSVLVALFALSSSFFISLFIKVNKLSTVCLLRLIETFSNEADITATNEFSIRS